MKIPLLAALLGAAPLKGGDKAPAFTRETDDGEKVSLSKQKGKQVVVYFYPKDDTPGCTKESIAFTGALGKFEKANTTVIGVSRDSCASHAKRWQSCG